MGYLRRTLPSCWTSVQQQLNQPTARVETWTSDAERRMHSALINLVRRHFWDRLFQKPFKTRLGD